MTDILVITPNTKFTQAAILLGILQSALSHSICGIENRLKIKSLYRTMCSVSTTCTFAFKEIYQKINKLLAVVD